MTAQLGENDASLFSRSSLAILPAETPDSSLFCKPRLLWFYLRARHGRDGHSYCSVRGCERVKVVATTSSRQVCNCSAKAYPKYSKTPSVAVPMPAPSTKPCKSCGAKQVGATQEEETLAGDQIPKPAPLTRFAFLCPTSSPSKAGVFQ